MSPNITGSNCILQNWTTWNVCVCVRVCMRACEAGAQRWVKQVSERWTFVQGRTAAHYLFMLMYLTGRLIAPGGAQLPTEACSPRCLTFRETGGWITCRPWLMVCVLFTFAELRFNSVSKQCLCLFRCSLLWQRLAAARERHSWERGSLTSFVAVIMADKGKVFLLLLFFCLFFIKLTHGLLQWTPVRM